MCGQYLYFLHCYNNVGHWQEPGPIILLEIDEGLKVGFHYAILSFGLAISLKVKSGKKFLFNFEKIAEQ